MGIADRHYARRQPPPPPSLARPAMNWRGWSVNTWIIIVCVAVFMVDTFTPTSFVPTGNRFPQSEAVKNGEVVRPDSPREGPSRVTFELPDGSQVAWPALPVVDPETNEQIGWAQVLPVPMYTLERYLHFSTQKGFLQFEFWRLIGFQFLHAHGTIAHILFNMIGLFFFGPAAERYLGSKRYLAFYLLCGMAGALMYCLLNLLGFVSASMGMQIPGLLFNDLSTPLIGASAGVFGVIMAGAYLNPNATVLLFFFLPLRLITLAYGLVAVAFFTLLVSGHNAGGEAGHLGGAIAGFYLIRHPHHLHNFFDILGRADPTSHHYRHGGRATAPGGGTGRPQKPKTGRKRAEIDRILEKIHREGLKSLSEKEKRILREASDDDQ